MRRLLLMLPIALAGCLPFYGAVAHRLILPEQRTIQYRDPERLPAAVIPPAPPPRTVSDPGQKVGDWELSLDEAIKIALVNARVVRVLAGLTAITSGRTIYDAAIANTLIDVEQARFDPVFQQRHEVIHTDRPSAAFDPFDRTNAIITGTQADAYRKETQLGRTNLLGGQSLLRWVENPVKVDVPRGTLPLNPRNDSVFELSYTQPFLQGAGQAVNLAPVVIARLDTERSFFQYKDSVQEMVRGVIEGYWALVQARTDVWARQNQLDQAEEAYQREAARLKAGVADLGTVAQAKVTYEQFRAVLIAAKANVLAREGALRNLLGLPPEDGRRLVPTSPPTRQRFARDWNALVRLAEQQRPDVVELKLVLEADMQRLLQAENAVLPRLDGFALYRWNGLSGEAPNGRTVSNGFGQFIDWTLGVNFSVPLGLRQGRARVRQQKLIIARDRANLDQSVHAAIHQLALTARELDNSYEQYLAQREVRAAALSNLQVQMAQQQANRNIYLDVLRALTAWGDAVSAEAQALTAYNVALATLERQTGTILETHGLVFLEERFGAAGPLGCIEALYPRALPPAGTPTRYPGTGRPSEDFFELKKPELERRPLVPKAGPAGARP